MVRVTATLSCFARFIPGSEGAYLGCSANIGQSERFAAGFQMFLVLLRDLHGVYDLLDCRYVTVHLPKVDECPVDTSQTAS